MTLHLIQLKGSEILRNGNYVKYLNGTSYKAQPKIRPNNNFSYSGNWFSKLFTSSKRARWHHKAVQRNW